MGNFYPQRVVCRQYFFKKYLTGPTLLLLLTLSSVISLTTFAQLPEKVPAQPVICPADFHDMFQRTPAMEKFMKLKRSGSREAATATFDVTFGPGAQANPEARAAFLFALEIWANELVSSVPIRVYADFATLGSGVLASAGPAYNVRNFSGAREQDVFYPAALANALAGTILFSDENFDLIVNLGNSIPWYFGLDGNTPAGLFDFATVALHEIGHGLGFTAIRGFNNSIGTIRSDGNTSVYSLFVVNGENTPLIAFEDPSLELGFQLTLGDIFMDGTFAKAGLSGERPELYAPLLWENGSSYAHWDEVAFPAGDPNSLMTPQVGSAESNFNIGDITRGLLKDMGWRLNEENGPPLVADPEQISAELFVGDTTLRWFNISSIASSAINIEIGTTTAVEWLTFDKSAESISSGDTERIAVLIDADGLTKGLHTTEIIITVEGTNDIILSIPVNLRVLDGTERPVISVMPNAFSETLQQLATVIRPLTIENSGDADLKFNIVAIDDEGNSFETKVMHTLNTIKKNHFIVEKASLTPLSKSINQVVLPDDQNFSRLVTSLYATDFEAFTPGTLNSQQGWGSRYPQDWIISGSNPFDGSLHFRGVSGLGSFLPAVAVSPAVVPLEEPFTVVSAEIDVQGTGVIWEFIPQAPSEGSVCTRFRINEDHTLSTFTPDGYIDIPAKIPEGYFSLKIVVDKDDATFRIFLDDEMIFVGQGFATKIEQLVIFSTMGALGSTFDMDNLEISDGDDNAFFVSALPDKGTVPFGSSREIDVKFDTRSLETGFYKANLQIISNDNSQPVVSVPVELTVNKPPTIVVESDSLTASVDVRADDPETVIRTFTIANNGDNPLEFSSSLDISYFSSAGIDSPPVQLPVEGSLRFTPTSGTIAPGNEMNVEFTFDGKKLANGTYLTNILIASNDPRNPLVTLPTKFSVTGHLPVISISDPLLFGNVFLGGELELPLYIVNDGLDILHVYSVTSDNSVFNVNTTALTIEAGDSARVNVTFVPTKLGNSAGIITIRSDASHNNVYTLTVEGVGTAPPVIVLDPEEQSQTTQVGVSTTASIKVRNEGSAPLLFSIPDQTARAMLADLELPVNDTQGDVFDAKEPQMEKGGADLRVGNQVLYSVGTDNIFGYTWIDNNSVGGPVYNFNDITSTGTEITDIVLGDGSLSVDLPFDFEFYGDVKRAVNINANGFLTFQEHPELSWNHTRIPYHETPNDLIAGFWADIEPQDLDGSLHYQLFADRLVVQWTNVPEFAGVVEETLTFQIVLYEDGNIDMFYKHVDLVNFTKFGTVGIENADGTDAAQVAFNTRYIKNGLALRFVKPPRGFTSLITNVSPASGVVPPGGEQTLEVLLDPNTLTDGVYLDRLDVSSNDPLSSSTTAFFELTVLGLPEITVEQDLLEFEPIFVGLTTDRSFLIQNTGTKTLEISSISNENEEFTLNVSGPRSILPNEEIQVTVTFEPLSIGTAEGEIVILSNDAYGQEMVVVSLVGKGLDPPVINVMPESLITSVPEGGEVTEVLTIANTGGSDLAYAFSHPYFIKNDNNPSTSNQYELLEFEPLLTEEQPDNRVGPTFMNASGGPDTFGYRWIDNNSGGPAYDFIDISTNGTKVRTGANDHVTVELPFNFRYFGEDHDNVTIAANGFLTFGDIVGYNFNNQQIPNAANPNNMIAGLWDNLQPQNGGGVFYKRTEEYVIVQYEAAPGYGAPPALPVPAPVTFQIILYPDGAIKFQYKIVGSSIATSCTIGLEGPMGIAGLQVIFNNIYLTPELAITFIPPTSGTVRPGESVEVPITFDASDFQPGIYEDEILIRSNDPQQSHVTVPVRLEVTDLPEVTSFTLIDATTNMVLGELREGAVINLDDYTTNNFSVLANTDPSSVGSVVFDFNGRRNFQRENVPPYALKGDRGGGKDYHGVEFPLGENSITATPYSGRGGTGSAGIGRTVIFRVTSDATFSICYGAEVLDYSPGNKINGSDLPAGRKKTQKALGAPQENDNYNFVSLGFGGSIVIRMECLIWDQEGDDLFIVETSFRDSRKQCEENPEKAMVEASMDGVNWVVIAGEICRDGAVDLANGNLEVAEYFRITDLSDPANFKSKGADGFDLDGLMSLPGSKSANAKISETMISQENIVPDVEDVAIEVYPNPVEGKLSISLNSEVGETVRISIYNNTGMINYAGEIDISGGVKYLEISMVHLSAGIYYLRLSNADDGIIAVKKLIKK